MEVARFVPHLQQCVHRGHHTPTSPNATLDNVALYLVGCDVTNGVQQTHKAVHTRGGEFLNSLEVVQFLRRESQAASDHCVSKGIEKSRDTGFDHFDKTWREPASEGNSKVALTSQQNLCFCLPTSVMAVLAMSTGRIAR